MSIDLVTYANKTVTPKNDAMIYEKAIDQNGIFYGCTISVSSNKVNITGGYGIICGREFTIETESIPVTLAPSGTLLGRLYVRLDLSDPDAPIQLLTTTGASLPALEQDADVNFTNGAYEMELATFDVGVSALTACHTTYHTISGTKDRLVVEAHTTDEITTGANTSRETTASFTKPGYYPLGIVGYYPIWVSGQTSLINFYLMYLSARSSGSTSVYYGLQNTGTGSVGYKLRFYILWVEE